MLLRATVVPRIEFSTACFFIITGVLGTTISPYTFFWQASEEVKEEDDARRRAPAGPGGFHVDARFIRNLRIDTTVGMIASEILTWPSIVVGATVLQAHGVTIVATAADAAKALEPLVQSFPHDGYLAKLIVAAGIIGLGLLAIPAPTASASYALCEAFAWHEGLNLRLRQG